MIRNFVKCSAIVAVCLVAAQTPAVAADAIKIGVIGQFSGMFADLGKRMKSGFDLYIKLHGDKIAGKPVELIYKDVGGSLGDVAKRMTTELIVRDKVVLLTGFLSTPNTKASLPISKRAKKPLIMVQAATSGLTKLSPFSARLSYTLGQISAPLGTWAAKNGIKTVFTIVADFGPGYDAENSFKATFTKGGGKIVGGVRPPLGNLDFAPYVQRARDAKADAIFVFVPAGQTAVAFMKTYKERGLAEAGIKLLTTGDVVDEANLDALGDAAIGAISTYHYSVSHDSPENKAFIKAYQDAYGKDARPDFLSMQAFDTMAVIYSIGNKLKGNLTSAAVMKELRGFKLESPRGAIQIDPKTGDVNQAIYIRRVERKGAHLENIEFGIVTPAGIK